jgi:hypothetical protein
MKADCRFCEDVNAFLAGELAPHEASDFSAHLPSCPGCQAALDASRRVLSRLRAVPAAEPAGDLAPRILARIEAPAPSTPPRRLWPRLAAVAAIAALFGGPVLWREAHPPSMAPTPASGGIASGTVDRALEWFVRTQEADGSWDAARWGGQRNYAPALTALPLLALAKADQPSPSQRAAAQRATRNLLSQQHPDGTFGPVFQGAPYNSSIATYALLHAWQQNPGSVPKAALDAAIAALERQQTPAGGWGYRFSPLADRSITQWHIQALEFAAELGWMDARDAAQRGIAWLATRASTEPESEPADSTSALLARASDRPALRPGAIDYYQVYFTTCALKHTPSADAAERLEGLRRLLLRHQAAEGPDSGSWPPIDQWGRAGGRLYSTAMASLALGSG